MKVLGIDPSLTGTGLALVDGTTLDLERECERAGGDDRLQVIGHAVHVACEGEPDFAVLEDLPTHGQGAGKTGMAQGVVRRALMNRGVPYVTVAPATLKVFATGKGGATKPDMRMELYRRTDVDVRNDNQMDAAWLRFLGLYFAGEPAFTLPQTHLRALAKVKRAHGTIPTLTGA